MLSAPILLVLQSLGLDLSNDTGMSTIYHTALTHSLSLTELEHLPQALLCVNECGIIEWIEKDVDTEKVDEVLKKYGAEGVEVVRIDDGGLVPGLIDTHTVSCSLSYIQTIADKLL